MGPLEEITSQKNNITELFNKKRLNMYNLLAIDKLLALQD